ncbi:hypothetical protein EVAR_71160_1 [Eumeta japonica]|uniref:Uncharacterized protein n=1 Tax=Eumeta variegata TaxID=151549 RepID=A0A4C1T4Z2_EUMVA|nr:hypothetical protein EVAR_71160_1 [Eumeta japonica]
MALVRGVVLNVSLILEATNTAILNSIPDNIETIDEIDHAIKVLTDHITIVVENSSRKVSAANSRQKLNEDVCVLLRVKNAALRCASAYPICINRKLAKALKTDHYLPTPAFKKPDDSFALDDREKAECLADSVEQQCSNNTIHDTAPSHRIDEEPRPLIVANKFIKDASKRFFDIAQSHPNPLIASAATYEPPLSYHFLEGHGIFSQIRWTPSLQRLKGSPKPEICYKNSRYPPPNITTLRAT